MTIACDYKDGWSRQHLRASPVPLLSLSPLHSDGRLHLVVKCTTTALAPHVTSTGQRAPSLTKVKAVNMIGAHMQFSSLRRWKMTCFLCRWMIKIWTITSSSQTYTPQCFTHGSTWEIIAGNIVAESWLCLCVAQRGKNTSDITECVLHRAGHCCHGDSVTHGSLIWI